MASVFKRFYWHVDASGKKSRRKYKMWTCKYKNAAGQWVTTRGYHDKEASRTKARQLEKRAERERSGILDPFEGHEATELSKHLADFESYLRSKGDCDDHVTRTKMRIGAILDGCCLEKIAHLNGSAVFEYLAACRSKGQFGKQTSNYYLKAIQGFSRWLVKNRRTAADPLVHLSGIVNDEEQARSRRAVSVEQFAGIIEATRGGPTIKRLPGFDRAMAYMLAAYTGFRAHELSTVAPESFAFEGDRAELSVDAGYSKRRKKDTQPLRSDLAQIVRTWLADKPAGELLWPGKWYRRAAEMLQVDLKAAGVPYIDKGRHLDFHALRHTYITSLHRGGAYGKVLQSLARHSTAALTARYTHVEVSDTDAAVEGLPPIPQPMGSKSASKSSRTA